MENVVKPYLGIDVGGTGIKAALVDVQTGALLTEKLRILTPKPATPESVAVVIKEAVAQLNYSGTVGCGFPSVIKENKVLTATNLDPSWINLDIKHWFAEHCGLNFEVLNDADAAGLAELHFGAAKGYEGLVIMITIGTGVGSGMYFRGELLHNTELGFLPVKGGIAETRISNKARTRGHLGWMVWGKRLNEYLQLLERLFSPQLIVLGGGVSKQFEVFSAYLDVQTPVLPAQMQNNSGCVGAAWFAASQEHQMSL